MMHDDNFSKLRRLSLTLLLLASGLMLTACGGSSAPAGQPTGTQPNTWDSMQWDQSEWG